MAGERFEFRLAGVFHVGFRVSLNLIAPLSLAPMLDSGFEIDF